MHFINLLLFTLLLTFSPLWATTYEDGEGKSTDQWHILNPSEDVTVQNVYDEIKGSHVVQLKGDGTRSAYLLMTKKGTPWNNKKEKVLHWQMNYSEDFVILVSLETKRGKRYLIYTPGSEDGYMQYGLGDDATEGGWHRYSRDLEKDLQYFDNQNSIVSVKSFVIRGSGEIDNVKLLKSHRIEEDSSPKAKKISKKHPPLKKRGTSKTVKKKIKSKRPPKIKTDSTPEIIIEGENPIFLALGESYEEPGVRAEDKEDGELVITSSENIDKHKEGIYSVIYMATDSNGNSAIDKRYVYIGEPTEDDGSTVESQDVVKKEHEANSTDESSDDQELDDDAQYRLEERELEIAEWEKELQLREKEIAQREQNIGKSDETEK